MFWKLSCSSLLLVRNKICKTVQTCYRSRLLRKLGGPRALKQRFTTGLFGASWHLPAGHLHPLRRWEKHQSYFSVQPVVHQGHDTGIMLVTLSNRPSMTEKMCQTYEVNVTEDISARFFNTAAINPLIIVIMIKKHEWNIHKVLYNKPIKQPKIMNCQIIIQQKKRDIKTEILQYNFRAFIGSNYITISFLGNFFLKQRPLFYFT